MKKILFLLSIIFLVSCDNTLLVEPVEQWFITPSDNNVITYRLDEKSDSLRLYPQIALTNGKQLLANVSISVKDTSIAYIKQGVIIPVALGTTTVVVSSKEHQGHSQNSVGLEYIMVEGVINVTE